MDGLLEVARLVQPVRFKRRPALSDPNDDLVLECALEAQATAIVTMNVADFTAATREYGLRVMKPGELVAELRRKAT